MNHDKKGAYIRKTDRGLDFYNNRNELMGSASLDDLDSVGELYSTFKRHNEQGYLSDAKYEQFTRLAEKYLGCELPADKRMQRRVSDAHHNTLVGRLMAMRREPFIVEVKFPKKAA